MGETVEVDREVLSLLVSEAAENVPYHSGRYQSELDDATKEGLAALNE